MTYWRQRDDLAWAHYQSCESCRTKMPFAVRDCPCGGCMPAVREMANACGKRRPEFGLCTVLRILCFHDGEKWTANR